MYRIRNQKGATLIELVLVVGIVAVLLGIAALAISEYSKRAALRESARSLEGFLYNARTAARTRQVLVTVSFTGDRDYTAFTDNNADGILDAGDVTLANGTTSGQVQLAGNADLPIPGSFQFNRYGMLNTTDASRLVTVNSLTDPGKQYRVWIFNTGATRVERSEDSGATWTRAW